MMRLTFIATIVLFMLSCNNSTINQNAQFSEQVDTTKMTSDIDSILQKPKEIDSNNADNQATSVETIYKKQNEKIDKRTNPSRFIEFPSDANFNGKPMTQQEDISKKILEKHPDTLSKLALARYKTYTSFFPKSISDNFEEGISTTTIHYPKELIFSFELFENESSWKPYIVKEVIVRRNPQGELNTE